MADFSSKYARLKSDKQHLEKRDYKDLEISFDPGKPDCQAFLSLEAFSVGIHETEGDYLCDVISLVHAIKEKNPKKISALTEDERFIEKVKYNILSPNGDPKLLSLKTSIAHELGLSNIDFLTLYEELKESRDADVIWKFLFHFRSDSTSDVGKYLEVFKRYLSLAGDGERNIRASKDDVDFICKAFSPREFQDFFEFLSDKAAHEDFGAVSALSGLEEPEISRFVKAVADSGIHANTKAAILDVIVRMFTAPRESFGIKGIYDYEREVLGSPLVIGFGELGGAGDGGFVPRLFKAVCESERSYKVGNAFSKFIGRFATKEDAQELGKVFSEGDNRYSDWWFVFYDALLLSGRPDSKELSEIVGTHISEKVKAREERSREWVKEAKRGLIKRKKEYEANVRSTLDVIRNDPEQYSPWLLSEYWERLNPKANRGQEDIATILDTKEVSDSIREQLSRVFLIDSRNFTWNVIEEREGGGRTWRTNNQAVGNGAYSCSILIADKIGFDVSPFRAHIVGYIPFCYEEQLQAALRLLGPLRNEDVAYLLSIYGKDRTDQLKYHLFHSFLSLLGAGDNAKLFISENKVEFRALLLSAVEDEEYGHSERLGAFELLFKHCPNVSIAQKFFDKYEDGKNYFNDVLPGIEEYRREHTEWIIRLKANRYLVEKGKERNILWTIEQLKNGLVSMRDPSSEGVHFLSLVEHEMIWSRGESESLANVLGVVRDQSYADEVNSILKRAFDLLESNANFYSLYADYLLRAVKGYYLNIRGGNCSFIPALQRLTSTRSPLVKARFSNYLNTLRLSSKKEVGRSTQLYKKRIKELESENERLGKDHKKSDSGSGVLLVEGSTDRDYIKKAWGLFVGQPMPFAIFALGGCGVVGAAMRVEGNEGGGTLFGILDHDAFSEVDSCARGNSTGYYWNPCDKSGFRMLYKHETANRFITLLQIDQIHPDLHDQVYTRFAPPVGDCHLGKSAIFNVEHLFYGPLKDAGESKAFFSIALDRTTKRPYYESNFKKKKNNFKNELEKLATSEEDEKRLYANFKPTIDLIKRILVDGSISSDTDSSSPGTSGPTP